MEDDRGSMATTTASAALCIMTKTRATVDTAAIAYLEKSGTIHRGKSLQCGSCRAPLVPALGSQVPHERITRGRPVGLGKC